MPMVVATLCRARIAHRLAPCPRCATITRPSARSPRKPGQAPSDRCIGKSVKSVADHAVVRQITGQCEQPRQPRLIGMEGGIETGHLRTVRPASGDGTDGGQIVRLMRRHQRTQAGQCLHHPIIHQAGTGMLGATMHDPVADRADCAGRLRASASSNHSMAPSWAASGPSGAALPSIDSNRPSACT